jgi:hypothetical protein
MALGNDVETNSDVMHSGSPKNGGANLSPSSKRNRKSWNSPGKPAISLIPVEVDDENPSHIKIRPVANQSGSGIVTHLIQVNATLQVESPKPRKRWLKLPIIPELREMSEIQSPDTVSNTSTIETHRNYQYKINGTFRKEIHVGAKYTVRHTTTSSGKKAKTSTSGFQQAPTTLQSSHTYTSASTHTHRRTKTAPSQEFSERNESEVTHSYIHTRVNKSVDFKHSIHGDHSRNTRSNPKQHSQNAAPTMTNGDTTISNFHRSLHFPTQEVNYQSAPTENVKRTSNPRTSPTIPSPLSSPTGYRASYNTNGEFIIEPCAPNNFHSMSFMAGTSNPPATTETSAPAQTQGKMGFITFPLPNELVETLWPGPIPPPNQRRRGSGS